MMHNDKIIPSQEINWLNLYGFSETVSKKDEAVWENDSMSIVLIFDRGWQLVLISKELPDCPLLVLHLRGLIHGIWDDNLCLNDEIQFVKDNIITIKNKFTKGAARNTITEIRNLRPTRS